MKKHSIFLMLFIEIIGFSFSSPSIGAAGGNSLNGDEKSSCWRSVCCFYRPARVRIEKKEKEADLEIPLVPITSKSPSSSPEDDEDEEQTDYATTVYRFESSQKKTCFPKWFPWPFNR